MFCLLENAALCVTCAWRQPRAHAKIRLDDAMTLFGLQRTDVDHLPCVHTQHERFCGTQSHIQRIFLYEDILAACTARHGSANATLLLTKENTNEDCLVAWTSPPEKEYPHEEKRRMEHELWRPDIALVRVDNLDDQASWGALAVPMPGLNPRKATVARRNVGTTSKKVVLGGTPDQRRYAWRKIVERKDSVGFRACPKCKVVKPKAAYSAYAWNQKARNLPCIACKSSMCLCCGQVKPVIQFGVEIDGSTSNMCKACAVVKKWRCSQCKDELRREKFPESAWRNRKRYNIKCNECLNAKTRKKRKVE